jgi:hypothetical protein
MKKTIISLACVLFLATLCFAQSDDPRLSTQAGMNEMAYEKFEKTEKEMNSIYRQILEENKEDGNFIKEIKNRRSPG